VTIARQYTGDLGRDVLLREEGSDRQVWADTFTGCYHWPPDWMPAPSTVLDLGANIGLTAAHYKTCWPWARVVAVEMDEESAALAKRNAPLVEVRTHAVSAVGGWGSYDPNRLAEAFSFSPGDTAGKLVSSYTLRQTILRTFGRRGVDFVKMDVEGAEWSIFAHPNWAHLVRCLLVELHAPNNESSADLVALAVGVLREIGFEAAWHPPHPQSVFAWKEPLTRA
jgi:FkbM family methyltransferase